MNNSSPTNTEKTLSITGSTLENVQIGGIAGRDQYVTQVQGGVSVTNVFGSIFVKPSPVAPAQALNRQEYRWRQVLLEKVKQYWIEGVLEQSLHSKVMIELGLEECLDAVKRPLIGVEEFPMKSRQVFAERTAATDIFDQMGTGRTLLIVGEAGSGKTITLLKLARSLISRARMIPSQPIPLVFNLSSWASKRPPLKVWLLEELYNIYGVYSSLGKSWIEQESLILLLDGLDEVESKYRNDCVIAINKFVQEFGLTEMVVCSRVRDYEELSDRLMLRSAIYIQPLTSKQIDSYLLHAKYQLDGLRKTIQDDRDLQRFASSPLILSIMSLAYRNISKEEMKDLVAQKKWRTKLFEIYIDRMLNRKYSTQYPDKNHIKRWLIWIAKQMQQNSQTVFMIENIQPTCLYKDSHKIRYKIESSCVCGLISGLIIGFVEWITEWLNVGFYQGTISGIGAGLFYVIIISLFIFPLNKIKTTESLKWSWKEMRIAFKNNRIRGIFVGSFFGFLLFLNSIIINGSGIHIAILIGLFTMTFVMLLTMTLFSVISALRGPDVREKKQPNEGIFRSIYNSIAIGVPCGLLFGSIVFLTDGILEAVSNGTAAGLLACLGGGAAACLRHFSLRFMLYRIGHIPWNYSHFLDYAVEHLFMQKVGGGYIFIHRMLLEHFARMSLPRQSDSC